MISRLKELSDFGFKIAPSLDRTITNVRDSTMQVFHIRYRNSQGALMRILNAVSRRGLDLTSVHTEAAAEHYEVALQLEVTPKQMGQLYREWFSIVDVVDVRSSVGLHGHEDAQWVPLPPTSAEGGPQARAALA
jgi:acetolactate synthase regulatory subunit